MKTNCSIPAMLLLSITLVNVTIVHSQVSSSEVKVLNRYTDPLSVSIGTESSIQTGWKLIYSNMYARFPYHLTTGNYSHTYIYYRYDQAAFEYFLNKKSDKIMWHSAGNAAMEMMRGRDIPDFLDYIHHAKQDPLYDKAVEQCRNYYELRANTTDESKRQCLTEAINFTINSIALQLPSIGLEIDYFLQNVLAGKTFSIPISQQITRVKILSNQLEFGYYNSDCSFKNIRTTESNASFKSRLPFTVGFNQFIGKSGTLWPGTYLSLGYTQSPLMFNPKPNSLFQANTAIAYNHASIGIGYMPDVSKRSDVLITLNFEVLYRLNFRNSYQIDNYTGEETTDIKKGAPKPSGLESGNICFGAGIGVGYKRFILKAKLQYTNSSAVFDKTYRFPLDKCASGMITLSVPLATKNSFRYRW